MDDSHSKNKDLEERPRLLSICSQPLSVFSLSIRWIAKDQKQREQLSFGHKGEIEMEKKKDTQNKKIKKIFFKKFLQTI